MVKNLSLVLHDSPRHTGVMSTTYRTLGSHHADQDVRRVSAELAAMYAHADTTDTRPRVRLVRRALRRLAR
jgi:hypothetical protein